MREYKGDKFALVWAAIQNGAMLNDAVKAHDVSLKGYVLWRARHNVAVVAHRSAPLSAAFKSAEREIRAGKIAFIAEKHGLTSQDLYRRKKSTGEEAERLVLALEEMRKAPTTAEVCAKHGFTLTQLYNWRLTTGGLPKHPPREFLT